jgi:hypothetical protein
MAVGIAGAGAPGLVLTWRASNASPLVITAHRMRAFLLASATAAFYLVYWPARSLAQRRDPQRDRIAAPVGRHHGGLGTLDQQAAQVGVASFGDAAQAVLATRGVLARGQAYPGPELRTVPELLEVSHRGHRGAGGHGADAHQRGGLLHRGVVLGVRGNALVAPGQMSVNLAPLCLQALQRQARQGVHLVARVFEHIAQHRFERAGALREDQAEFAASNPRMRLMQAVRSAFKPSRRRCTHSMLCCSSLDS